MRNLVATMAATAILLSSTALAAEDWYPSKYGPDDTIGAANNLSLEKVLEAVKLVKTGKTYSLAIRDRDVPRPPISHGHLSYSLCQQVLTPPASLKARASIRATTTFSKPGSASGRKSMGLAMWASITDITTGSMPQTLWIVRGSRSSALIRSLLSSPAASCSTWPPISGSAWYPKARLITVRKLRERPRRQGVTIRKGDVVIFHSGWMQLLGKENKRWVSVHPGPGVEGAEYLADLGVVAVGADTAALEVIPWEDPERSAPVHQTLPGKERSLCS